MAYCDEFWRGEFSGDRHFLTDYEVLPLDGKGD